MPREDSLNLEVAIATDHHSQPIAVRRVTVGTVVDLMEDAENHAELMATRVERTWGAWRTTTSRTPCRS